MSMHISVCIVILNALARPQTLSCQVITIFKTKHIDFLKTIFMDREHLKCISNVYVLVYLLGFEVFVSFRMLTQNIPFKLCSECFDKQNLNVNKDV